ncbi:related to Cerevisin [Saccharomycodes ludwigii]|uniref:Related to Cerevisin n=1 Tax=Saccharomycodes ludwigii TaxID=36035 RepID=A0A376B8P3_9ASCO|nr:related to Cerevisin [Saccharomycodes ludwigii]
MKVSNTLLPLSVLVALGSALVIPEIDSTSVPAAKDSPKHKSKHEGCGLMKGKHHDESDSEYDSLDSALAALGKNTIDVYMADAEGEKNFKLAPIVNTNSNKNEIIPNRYIIVFKKGISAEEIDFHKELISEVHLNVVSNLSPNDPFFTSTTTDDLYGVKAIVKEGGIQDSFSIGDGLLSGYVGYFTEGVVDFIRATPFVDYVEQDSMVYANDFDTQNGAPWGLARISHREKLNLGSFNKYLFDDNAGEGVTSYVIDTGVNVEHVEFDGRAVWGKTIPYDDEDIDGNGHGTHCAGTIGSNSYGVAKKAKIVAVKVLRSNGSGTMSDVIKGVEYAAESHTSEVKKNNKKFKGSTANMSLGGGKSPTLDLAVNAAVKAGLHFAVAAGNEDQDACNTSPAAAENAVTVGASTLSDDRAYFSNWGSCVDVFAPGLNILSTYIGSDSATAVLSGTSMASPHVAGLLTYYLSLQPDSDSAYYQGSSKITPALLKKKVLSFATKDVLSDIDSETPNLLIFNGGGEDLSDFWGKDIGNEREHEERLDESHLQETLGSLVDSIGGKTDNIFEEVRHLFEDLRLF